MKRLVICCDGTWNRADQARQGKLCPTNVVRLGLRIAKCDAAVPQVLYYDRGVGTGNVLDRYLGGLTGAGLEENLEEAYRFLVANYEPDDELWLFGFSRGAFTVRSLAGLVRKCGILDRRHAGRYREAQELYRNPDHPDEPGPAAFRRRYGLTGSEPVRIRFIGVWDTVGALGIPLRGLRWLSRGKQFHDTELSGSVDFGCHALAIDERRAPFAPTLWTYKPKPGQTVEQVWFCGTHGAVGGCAERGLADITLEWMIGRARAAGLAFDASVARTLPTAPDPLGPFRDSKRGLYLLTRGIDRPIGLLDGPNAARSDPLRADPTQAIHDSVRQRWDREPRYRPRQLAAYFARERPPVAAPVGA